MKTREDQGRPRKTREDQYREDQGREDQDQNPTKQSMGQQIPHKCVIAVRLWCLSHMYAGRAPTINMRPLSQGHTRIGSQEKSRNPRARTRTDVENVATHVSLFLIIPMLLSCFCLFIYSVIYLFTYNLLIIATMRVNVIAPARDALFQGRSWKCACKARQTIVWYNCT